MVEVLFCLVVAIADGDTLKVRCGQTGAYEQVTIRLADIDAPEKRQPFGTRSRLALSQLCYMRWASFDKGRTDRYGRTVARVKCQGQDASAEQVKAGMAWAYAKYLKDPEIKRLEQTARHSGLGLWSDPVPVEPWVWRKQK